MLADLLSSFWQQIGQVFTLGFHKQCVLCSRYRVVTVLAESLTVWIENLKCVQSETETRRRPSILKSGLETRSELLY